MEELMTLPKLEVERLRFIENQVMVTENNGQVILNRLINVLRYTSSAGLVTEIQLRPKETRVLAQLMLAEGAPVTREQLHAVVFGDVSESSNIVDVYVNYLRKKLAKIGIGTQAIESVRGVGYRWVGEVKHSTTE